MIYIILLHTAFSIDLKVKHCLFSSRYSCISYNINILRLNWCITESGREEHADPITGDFV